MNKLCEDCDNSAIYWIRNIANKKNYFCAHCKVKVEIASGYKFHKANLKFRLIKK